MVVVLAGRVLWGGNVEYCSLKFVTVVCLCRKVVTPDGGGGGGWGSHMLLQCEECLLWQG